MQLITLFMAQLLPVSRIHYFKYVIKLYVLYFIKIIIIHYNLGLACVRFRATNGSVC